MRDIKPKKEKENKNERNFITISLKNSIDFHQKSIS